MRVFTDRNSALKTIWMDGWLMNDIFHVRTLQRLDERMVWLEPLFYFIYSAKNRTWVEGGIFKETRRMAFIQSLYIAKGGLGVKVPWIVQYPCNTSSVGFFCSLISETRRVYFSFLLFSGQQTGGAGLEIVLLARLRALCSTYLSTHGAAWGSFRLLNSTVSGSWHATKRVSGSCSCGCLVKAMVL